MPMTGVLRRSEPLALLWETYALAADSGVSRYRVSITIEQRARPGALARLGAAIVGGVIGGLIIGAAIADATDSDTHVVLASHNYNRPGGYWRTVDVRTWVPGYWVSERRYGRIHRYYVDGHYEIRTRRGSSRRRLLWCLSTM